MGIQLVYQKVNGKNANTITADDSVITALNSFLVGTLSVYKQEGSTTGTSIPYPAMPNAKTISCGKKTGKAYKNCSFAIKHVKESKQYPDIAALVVGQFDANYATSEKATYCNLVLDSRKAA
jgi:hypothetical protein